ncbi:hypothetical protein GFPCMMHI_02845 [Ensifer adhaerens]|nr:hypothetical protein [Ensifer adhaerens]
MHSEVSGDFEKRQMIGRVSQAEITGSQQTRISLEIDAIEISHGTDLALLKGDTSPDRFAIMRISSTPRRIAEVFDAEMFEIQEGSWLKLEITSVVKSKPKVKLAQLSQTGYDQISDVSIESGSLLFNDGPLDFRPFPAGATVPDVMALATSFANECLLPSHAYGSEADIVGLLSSVPKPHHVSVYDVGQASFIALNDEGSNPLIYYDVGWPIFFNKRTAPKHFAARRVPYVILSHWDFDHLLGFYKFDHLRNATWIVPEQNLGPGARRIANILLSGGNLIVCNADELRFSWGRMSKCLGEKNHANNSGNALSLELQSGKRVLLVGDADYDRAGLPTAFRHDFLVATHHGGKFAGSVPHPVNGQGLCVVSVGAGNVYHHPDEQATLAHRAVGWRLGYTSFEGNVGSRGNRRLGP